MKISALTQKKIGTVVRISLLSGAVTFVWGLVAGFGIPIALKFHVSMGFFAAFIIGSVERFALEPIAHRLNFLFLLIVRAFLYVFVILSLLIVLAPVTGYAELTPLFSAWQGPPSIYAKGLAYGMIASFVFSLIYSLQRILGQGTLARLLMGNYHRPSEQQRIFMFLDVKSSTTIAEKIGHHEFMLLLNDFYYHISSAVIMAKGEIYKYVGDEIIVTWTMEKGIKNANCIECFFDALAVINRNRHFYLGKYGFVPEFRAGIHGGAVVAGMLGANKAEIAYLGDVLNTASRIQAECREANEQLLISGEIIGNISLPEHFKARRLEKTKLRGREREVDLYSVDMKSTLE